MLKKGFTLLELSIVLVLIGMIVGGILAGQELIRASELNSVATHMTKYQAAYNQYKAKYNAVPGDDITAYSRWGADCAGSAGDCNGNGDRRIYTNDRMENYIFFKHLFLANLIDDNLSGIASTPPVRGDNIPMMDIPGTSLYPNRWPKYQYLISSTSVQVTPYANILTVARIDTANHPNEPAFTPEDAKAIDSKLDDGQPGTGIIIAGESGVSDSSGCTDADDSSATTARLAIEEMKNSSYRVSDTTLQCSVGLILEEPV